MSLKSQGDRKQLLKKLKEGQVVRGTIQHIKDIGVFVQLEHTSLTGFVHKSQLSDKFVSDINATHKIGQGAPPPHPSAIPPCIISGLGCKRSSKHFSLTWFVRKSQLSDKFVSDINATHSIGQGAPSLPSPGVRLHATAALLISFATRR